AYFQDDWRITPDLTLNLGIRWEYSGRPVDRFDRLASFDLPAGRQVFAGRDARRAVVRRPRRSASQPGRPGLQQLGAEDRICLAGRGKQSTVAPWRLWPLLLAVLRAELAATRVPGSLRAVVRPGGAASRPEQSSARFLGGESFSGPNPAGFPGPLGGRAQVSGRVRRAVESDGAVPDHERHAGRAGLSRFEEHPATEPLE